MLKCQNPECGKVFLYAAKLTVQSQVQVLNNDKTSVVASYSYPETIEHHVCPYCKSPDLREVEETQPHIESIVSVKIAEADDWIKKGYEVQTTYASTVNLVKKAKETAKP
jgi:ribosomal protein L32